MGSLKVANLDPFSIQWPKQWIQDPEIGPVITYLNRYLTDLFVVLDGGNAIENIEVQQVAEDGGNRTQRRVRDEIDEISNNLAQVKRQNRVLEQSLHGAIESIEKVSRRSRQAEQSLNDALETISQTKRSSRLTEQKITELTERHDDGT